MNKFHMFLYTYIKIITKRTRHNNYDTVQDIKNKNKKFLLLN